MKIKLVLLLYILFLSQGLTEAARVKNFNEPVNLPGFNVSPYYDEQVITFYFSPEVRIQINAPAPNYFNPNLPVGLALFALPNGNTIEQTVGKILETGDDWHYDIQHIGAQTRFLRQTVTEYNLVTVYLEAAQKSWPTWSSKYPNHAELIKKIVEYLKSLFSNYNPFVVLTGHSGGGRFTFSFMDGFNEIPDYVKRISFLDSDYGYETVYGDKIVQWLNASEDNYLSVIAYNDSVALYNGNPIVSPTGGTWYRSKLMKSYLSNYFTFTDEEDSSFIRYTALNGRIKFILKKNPLRQILHTVQVERNGFIQGMVSGTQHENEGYDYYGARAYSQWIQIDVNYPQPLTIPPRASNAKSGSEFMQYVRNMTFADRETEIYNEVSTGNIPNYLRKLKTVETNFNDANGVSHSVKYEVMPDYLAIGSDSDFCRIPTGPITAQRLADLFGAVMPTRKLVDNIYTNCEIKLEPVTYTPVGNQNELVSKFIEHNSAIQQQFINAGGILGQLTGGIKKDVVLSNKIIDPTRPNHVVIYGWHQLNGQPIQPLTNIHINTYTDYSHGIRFLNSEITLDGVIKNIQDILTDPAMYKILSDEDGVMVQPTYISSNTFAPSQPKSFGIKTESENEIRVMIKQVANVESYQVSLSKNGIDFNPPFSSSTNNFVISNLPADSIVYVKIAAVNAYGTSPESEVLAGVPTNITPEVIIVNGFDRGSTGNTYNFIRQHGSAFLNNGVAFESATNDGVIDSSFNLNDYNLADYILGEESTADETYSSNEQEIIKSYLRKGGNLFVSGSEIAWDLDYKGSASDKDFIWNYLKMKYIEDAPGNSPGAHYQVSSQSNSIFDGINSFYFDNGTHGTINVKYPDVIKGISGGEGCLLYTGFDSSYGSAGIYFSGLFNGGIVEGKVVSLGFPFETVYPESISNELMKKLMFFFGIATQVIDKNNTDSPSDFKLYQNYPNPFNPTTKIKYSIPSVQTHSDASVQLKVYDILGREVATLVNEVQLAGNYEIEFNSTETNSHTTLPSGVYFYKLDAGSFHQIKKMILLK